MKKYLKWFAIIAGILMAIMPLILISPLLLPASGLALWYFTKKKPNERFAQFAKKGLVAGAVGFGLFVWVGMSGDGADQDLIADSEELVADIEAEEDVEREEDKLKELAAKEKKEQKEKKKKEFREKLAKEKAAREK